MTIRGEATFFSQVSGVFLPNGDQKEGEFTPKDPSDGGGESTSNDLQLM